MNLYEIFSRLTVHPKILDLIIIYFNNLPLRSVPTFTVNWTSVNVMSIGLFLGKCMSTIRVADVILNPSKYSSDLLSRVDLVR